MQKSALNLLGALAARNFLTASPNGPSEFAYRLPTRGKNERKLAIFLIASFLAPMRAVLVAWGGIEPPTQGFSTLIDRFEPVHFQH